MHFRFNTPQLKEKRRHLRQNQTEAEKVLWKHLRGKRLAGCKFFQQYSVGQYILDFYAPEIHLAIELDGSQHAEEQKEYDMQRTQFLESVGISVKRFWNSDVLNNIEGVISKIVEIVKREEVTPSNSPLT